MILHWLSTAWRQLIANPLFSLITIASLSIGACGALLAGANIKQHLSFERGYADADRIFLVRMREFPAPGTALAEGRGPIQEGVFSHNVQPALRAAIEGKLPGMVAQTRVIDMRSPLLVDENGEPTKDVVRYVDPEFFNVFEYTFLEGDKSTALATPEWIVLTESKAKELFGGKPAIGRELRGTENRTLRVSAVISDPPSPTMLEFAALTGIPDKWFDPNIRASLDLTRWRLSLLGGHYIRIGKDVDRAAFIKIANAYIQDVYSAGMRGAPNPGAAERHYRVSLVPLTDIHLAPREATGIASTADTTMLATLAAAASALLAVSAFNYVVMSLARTLRRKREVGVRKALGASGGAIIRHYWTEAALVTLISVALGFGLAELLHPWFARTLGQEEALFDLYDPVFLAASLGGGAVLALLVGAYPALYLAHVRPHAGLESSGEDSFGGLGRFITVSLLGLEIAAATVLLAVALTMAAQARYIAERPLGFRLDDMYAVTTYCGDRWTSTLAPSNPQCSGALDRIARQTPGIKRVAYSSNPGIFATSNPRPITRPGGQSLGEGFAMTVDTDFLPMVRAKLVAGRLFDANSAYDRRQLDAYPNYPPEPFDAVPVVVTRALLPMLGADTLEQALGQRIKMAPDQRMVERNPWTRSYEIIGVVEDWHQRSLRHAVAPIVFIPGGVKMLVIAEITEPDVASVQAHLSAASGLQSDVGPINFTLTPLQTAFVQAYDADRKLMGAVTSFAGLAILVAGLGVFGLSAFDIRRRVREIGIRKALGAAPASVAGMVLSSSLVSAAIASILSWPLAWWFANGWLESFAYRTNLGLAVLPVSSAVVIAFVALAVFLNATRAAAIRPSHALRTAA